MWFLYAVITALLYGTENILSKLILKKEDCKEYLALTYLIGIILLIPFFQNVSIEIRLLPVIVFRSVLMAIAMILYFNALKFLPISTVSPITSIIPVFTLILGALLLSETLSLLQIFAIFLILSASYFINLEDHWHEPIKNLFSSKYLYFLLLFLIFRSLVSVLSKSILFFTNSLSLLTLHYAIMAFIMLFIIKFDFKILMTDLKKDWIGLSIISAIGLLASYTTFLAYSDKASVTGIVVAVISAKTALVILFGRKYFHEKHILPKFIASLFILGGVYLLSI